MADAELAPVDAPEVAAPAAEPQVVRTTPETASPATPEAISPPTEITAPDSPEDDGFGDFLKEVGIEANPDTTVTTPADTESAPDPKVLEAAERLYQQRVTAAQEAAQSAQLAQSFDQTPNTIYHALVADGMAPARALEYFNAVKGLATAAEQVLGPRTNVATVQSFYTEMAKMLPKGEAEKFVAARGVDHKSPGDTARAFAEAYQKANHLVSEKEAKARESKAVIDKLRELDAQNLLVRNRKPSDASGNTIATIGRMNFKTLGEAEAAHVAGQISNAAMRQILAEGKLPR